jgi:hypothetical protein
MWNTDQLWRISLAKYDYGGGCPCGLERECPPGCQHYVHPPLRETTKVNKMKLNEDDDFGFTFADSTEIQAKVTTTEDKLQGLRKMIMPLLNNLMKNPDKDTILWPDREKKIKAFIKKMDDYINN